MASHPWLLLLFVLMHCTVLKPFMKNAAMREKRSGKIFCKRDKFATFRIKLIGRPCLA